MAKLDIQERINLMGFGMNEAYEQLKVGNIFLSAGDIADKWLERNGGEHTELNILKRHAVWEGACAYYGDFKSFTIDRYGRIEAITPY